MKLIVCWWVLSLEGIPITMVIGQTNKQTKNKVHRFTVKKRKSSEYIYNTYTIHKYKNDTYIIIDKLIT